MLPLETKQSGGKLLLLLLLLIIIIIIIIIIILESPHKHKYYVLEPAGREKTGSDRPYPLCIHTHDRYASRW